MWFALVLPLLCHAAPEHQGAVFTIIEENDLVVKTDRHYTQGIKLSYLHEDGVMPGFAARLLDYLPAMGLRDPVGKFGYEIGQSIYTPGDISIATNIPNERPYGGWLYTGLVLQRRGVTAARGTPVLDNFQLDLGIIGPESLAREAQIWVHEIRGFALPQGWDNQINTEPAIEAKFERTWRLETPPRNGISTDFLPRVGLSLGNVETSGRAGITARLGWHLPKNFGVQTIDSITTPEGGWVNSQPTLSHFGVYGFASAQGKAVLHEASLDGNLFQDSNHVEKEPIVGEFTAGFAVQLYAAEVGFTYVYRTAEFRFQSEHDGFGSVYLKVLF